MLWKIIENHMGVYLVIENRAKECSNIVVSCFWKACLDLEQPRNGFENDTIETQFGVLFQESDLILVSTCIPSPLTRNPELQLQL